MCGDAYMAKYLINSHKTIHEAYTPLIVCFVTMCALVLYSYEGPGKHVTLSLRACETNLFCVQLYWLIELYMGHISLDCKKSDRV